MEYRHIIFNDLCSKTYKTSRYKNWYKILFVVGERYRFFRFSSTKVLEKIKAFAEGCFIFLIHICLPTLASILTWPENDIGRTCIYSNVLSKTVKKCCSVPWFLRHSMGGTGLTFFEKYFREYFKLDPSWDGLFCGSCQYIPRPSLWATEIGPMCKCRNWSKVEKSSPLALWEEITHDVLDRNAVMLLLSKENRTCGSASTTAGACRTRRLRLTHTFDSISSWRA